MGFERYVDYALDVPMYFVKRGDSYIDVSGKSFRDHLAGKLLPGERATISDWANHVSTIFPEVRLKRYLEMRGSDGGPWRRLPSLPAFWVGLMYDDANLDACWEIVKDWTARSARSCATTVPRLGFEAAIRGRNVLDLRSRDARARRTGPGEPQTARPQRPRRNALPALAPGDRGARHHAGGGASGKVPKCVERLNEPTLAEYGY